MALLRYLNIDLFSGSRDVSPNGLWDRQTSTAVTARHLLRSIDEENTAKINPSPLTIFPKN